MFRKNYLPEGSIYRCSRSGEYFFKEAGRHKLVKGETGEFHITFDAEIIPTYYADTVDDILAALYEYAYRKHLRQIHRNITYSKRIKL